MDASRTSAAASASEALAARKAPAASSGPGAKTRTSSCPPCVEAETPRPARSRTAKIAAVEKPDGDPRSRVSGVSSYRCGLRSALTSIVAMPCSGPMPACTSARASGGAWSASFTHASSSPAPERVSISIRPSTSAAATSAGAAARAARASSRSTSSVTLRSTSRAPRRSSGSASMAARTSAMSLPRRSTTFVPRPFSQSPTRSTASRSRTGS